MSPKNEYLRLCISNELVCTPNEDRMPKLRPREVDRPNYPKWGPQNYWLFIFWGYGFGFYLWLKFLWILIVKSSSCECEYQTHLFSEIRCHHSSESFTLYFYSLCTFSLINRKLCINVSLCLWLYLWYIYVILLDIWYIFVHFFIISSLSFRDENNLDHS